MEQSENMQRNQKYQNRDLVGGVEKLYLHSKTADMYFKFGSDDDPHSNIRIPAHKIYWPSLVLCSIQCATGI